MSEAPKRTKETVSQEYYNLCTKVGHASYQVATIQKDIELMHSAMKDLNLEAAALTKAAEEAAKAAPSA
jgi:hypothetical protein